MSSLSILICSIPERKAKLDILIHELWRQKAELNLKDEEFEIIINDTAKGIMSVGAKRNDLKSRANRDYIAFFDDDDVPAPNYLYCLMHEISTGCDIISFNMNYFVNGKFIRKYIIHRFGGEVGGEDLYIIDRIYFHLCAVKREIANKIEFEDKNLYEDMAYSYAIKPLLSTEHHINDCLYNYYFDEKLTATRDSTLLSDM